KGIEKPVDQAEGVEQRERSTVKAEKDTIGSAAASGEDMTSSSGDETNYSEADYFENPYSVLAEIAQQVGQQANVSARGEGGAADSGPATGADGGEAYRDPFDPDFWTRQIQVTSAEKRQEAQPVAPADVEAPAEDEVALAVPRLRADTKLPENPEAKAEDPEAKAEDTSKAEDEADEAAQSTSEVEPETTESQETQAKELYREIATQIKGIAGKLAEGLIVTPTEGGLLVTISDQSTDPMFNIGSAVPRREMVLAMEKIGQILKSREGSVLVRGHTDARQFKGSENDNWRLSMARAHSAYYMLLRAGPEEQRVQHVSGYADRRLQEPDDPLAAVNRRIAILVWADEGRW